MCDGGGGGEERQLGVGVVGMGVVGLRSNDGCHEFFAELTNSGVFLTSFEPCDRHYT